MQQFLTIRHKPYNLISSSLLLNYQNINYHPKFIVLYKYNILERVLVENIIPRNVIINRGAAKVDNCIWRDDFSTSTLSRMLYLFYYTQHYSCIF